MSVDFLVIRKISVRADLHRFDIFLHSFLQKRGLFRDSHQKPTALFSKPYKIWKNIAFSAPFSCDLYVIVDIIII